MKQLFMIRKSAGVAGLATALFLSMLAVGDAAKISSLRMEPHSGSSSYVIAKSGAVEVQDFLMSDPPRLVVDFVGAEHGLDQQQFDGDPSFVKSVRTSQFVEDPSMVTRIVFDLRENVAYQLTNESDAVTVRFYAKSKAEPQAQPKTMSSAVSGMDAVDLASAVDPKPAVETKPEPKVVERAEAEPAKQEKADTRQAWAAPKQPVDVSDREDVTPAAPVAKEAPKPSWTQTQSSTATPVPPVAAPVTTSTSRQALQPFAANTGLANNKSITIDVQNAHVRSVLRGLSEFSGVNIISGPEVDGNVTAHLRDVPWRQALDMILKSHGYGWREEYGMIRVSTLDKLTKEELEQSAAERQKDDLLPLHTEIMPLSYANAQEMKDALKEVMTKRGSIEVEKSNNALVVTDITRVLDKIRAMVAELDRKTRQVEIVAKMVDVDFEASREIGIRWEALNLNIDDVNGIADALISSPGQDPASIFRIGTVQSWGELQFILDALEREQKANIISNPRIVTADNREANILVGKEIPLIVSDEAGNPITELTKVGIILRVTPHVNQDNTVTLDLHPEVSELSAQATVQGGVIISLSEADTRVVVGHGETAVIGGLINEVETNLNRGVPGLMNIPLLGNLFKFQQKAKKKRELIIFVTPRIVDEMASNGN